MVAENGPAVAGVNRTGTPPILPCGTVTGRVAFTRNAALELVKLLTESAAESLASSMSRWISLNWPTLTVPKSMRAGSTEASGAVGVQVPFHVPPGLPLPVERVQVPIKEDPSSTNRKLIFPDPVSSFHVPVNVKPDIAPVMVPLFVSVRRTHLEGP